MTVADSGGRKVLAMVLVLVMVVVALAVGLWQWRSPRAFHQQGSGIEMYNRVGTVVLVGIADPRREMGPAELTVHSVEPRVTEGDAEVDVVVCHTGPGGGGIGTARGGGLERFCESHEAAAGAQLGPDDQLILQVRSEKPGKVVVEGVTVTYSHGWRRGSQVTGVTATVEFGTKSVRKRGTSD